MSTFFYVFSAQNVFPWRIIPYYQEGMYNFFIKRLLILHNLLPVGDQKRLF